MFPITIQFKNLEHSDFIWNSVIEHAEALEKYFDRIISCQVVVSAPHRHHHKGKIYDVQVHINLPGNVIIASADNDLDHAHEDIYVSIRDAFDATRRKIDDLVSKRRPRRKEHFGKDHAKIIKLFLDEGYGFIETQDRREIYFHENSVLHNQFTSLEIGDEVRFDEEMGEKGPQVTSLIQVGKSGHVSKAKSARSTSPEL